MRAPALTAENESLKYASDRDSAGVCERFVLVSELSGEGAGSQEQRVYCPESC